MTRSVEARELGYEIVDVFAETAFAGNPLAVVHDGFGLSTAQMATLAREFNLSETVFLLPRTDPAATYRVRIFTPGSELPFAGHPSIGAAVARSRRGGFGPGVVIQECGAGLLPITVTSEEHAVLTGGAPVLGSRVDPEPLALAVGLDATDLLEPESRAAGCGLSFPFVRVSEEAITRARLVQPEVIDHLALLAWDETTRTAHCRVFAPGVGVGEDPATGSAALAMGVWLVGGGLLPGDGTFTYTIHQGAEIGRPSLLRATVTARDGAAVSTTVEGRVSPIARGMIRVPDLRAGDDVR